MYFCRNGRVANVLNVGRIQWTLRFALEQKLKGAEWVDVLLSAFLLHISALSVIQERKLILCRGLIRRVETCYILCSEVLFCGLLVENIIDSFIEGQDHFSALLALSNEAISVRSAVDRTDEHLTWVHLSSWCHSPHTIDRCWSGAAHSISFNLKNKNKKNC